MRNLRTSKTSPAAPDPLLAIDDAAPGSDEHVERRKADDHHDHRKGDEQEHEVQQPLEPESIQRDRMGSKCDERHSCDLAASLETEQRIDGLHSAVDTDQPPFELVEWCRVDRLERITAQQQHVGGVDRIDLGEQPARRRSGTRHGGVGARITQVTSGQFDVVG